MLVRKSRISTLIKKERQKERVLCIKESNSKIQHLKKEMQEEHKKVIDELNLMHKQILFQKEKEIKLLKKEMEKNHSKYLEIRKREKHLDELTSEVEDEIERMIIKVQESLQPFYRTRAKVEATKRRSNKKDDKVESIFKAIK